MKKLLNEWIVVALDLAWKEREITGTLTSVGEDYILVEEAYDGQPYYIPLSQILYVKPTK